MTSKAMGSVAVTVFVSRARMKRASAQRYVERRRVRSKPKYMSAEDK